MLRISVVDFLNARPLTWGLLHEPPPGVSVSRDVPSVCAATLASGEADVGLIPSIEYQRIPNLQVVSGLGIAASSEVRSVLLVSDVSRRRIRSVSLDPASRTSAALTRILLKRVYGLSPEYRDGGAAADPSAAARSARAADPSAEASANAADLSAVARSAKAEADARLIIGDPALKTRLNGHVVLDLAAEWRAFSGHPFVFAFWAVREDAATPEVASLLRRSYEAGRAHLAALVAEESQASGLSAPVVEDYLSHALHFELDAGDLEGLDLFYRLAAEDGLVPAARPLRFL